MADDETVLTPLEVFVAGHALDRAIAEFGDDAVLRSARDKLDRTLQNVQAIDPKAAEQIQTHIAMMKPADEPRPPEGADRMVDKDGEVIRCPECGGKRPRPLRDAALFENGVRITRMRYCTNYWHYGY